MLFQKRKNISAETLTDLKKYLDGFFPPAQEEDFDACEEAVCEAPRRVFSKSAKSVGSAPRMEMPMAAAPAAFADAASLSDALSHLDESFSEMLLRKIDDSGMTDARCYKKAQVDRKLFSKIRSQSGYRPSKATALSFALALELSLEETRELLMKAGYALSHSSKADVIVEFFITRGIYDKFQVNEALYEFDQPLL